MSNYTFKEVLQHIYVFCKKSTNTQNSIIWIIIFNLVSCCNQAVYNFNVKLDTKVYNSTERKSLLLDGKKVSAKILAEIKNRAFDHLKQYKICPTLAILSAEKENQNSGYINSLKKSCENVDIVLEVYDIQEFTEHFLIKKIHELNNKSNINGIVVQLPLPKGIDIQRVMDSICLSKDVDGLSSLSYGMMAKISKDTYHISSTPQGILMLLDDYKIDLSGKNCVIIGRGSVGAYLSALLSSNRKGCNATVTTCHSLSENIIKYTKEADVIIVAIGKPNYVSANMIKEGAIVIDVGFNQIEDKTKECGYCVVGDVDFNEVYKKTSYITPVPGGVGPMTTASLLYNVVNAATTQLINT